MRQGLLQVGYILIGTWLSANIVAQEHTADSLVPALKFQKNDYLLNPGLSSRQDHRMSSSATGFAGRPDTKLQNYDTILYYPLHRKGVSIDLGVNLRLQEDQPAQVNAHAQDWLSIDPYDTRPLVHAAAVFDLPFSGFKAGLSGTYNPDLNNTEYDYRAKLSYKWKSGLGLEGGWQHQQKTYEQQNFNETFDVQTLFLDMNYRF